MIRAVEQLREAATFQNITQAQIARDAGISVSGVSRILSGNRNPSAGTLERMAAGVGRELRLVPENKEGGVE